MSTGLVVLGALFLAYYAVMLLAGMDFSFVWLAGAVVCIGGGILWKYLRTHGQHLPPAVKVTGIAAIAVLLLLFLAVEGLIAGSMGEKGEEDLDYVIVLGAQVRGTKPSKALRKRIDKAAEYLKDNPRTKAVVSGGQGNGEDLSEARVMYDCLLNAGISKDRLMMEDKSTSTVENLKFSAKLTGKSARIGLISQNFHIYRAVHLARHQGFANVCGIAAPSEWIYQPHFLVREFFAVIKEKLTGNM